MNSTAANHYEQAFACRLEETRIPFVSIDQSQRPVMNDKGIKNFDFLLWPEGPRRILVEVKGRTFTGTSLAGRTGLDCWVTRQDTQAMQTWHRLFSQEQTADQAVFLFAFCIKQIDIDPDGLTLFEFDNRRYVFFVIRAQNYLARMKRRSPRWQTVTLSSEDVKALCIPLDEYIQEVLINE